MSDDRRGRPVLIELPEDAAAPGPEAAPPVHDGAPEGRGAAMRTVAELAARPRSALVRWFWALGGALFSFWLGIAAWRWVEGLVAAAPLLGAAAVALLGAFVLVLVALALRELAAIHRLARIDRVQKAAAAAHASADLAAARRAVRDLSALYAARPEAEWGRARLAEREAEILDADGLLGLAETELLQPLDKAAMREVEAAARQVATVTAVVPLALADVASALFANLRMIRRIAEIYGGRSGTVEAWRLTRAVLTHLVATGAVAVGDDLIHSVAGGSILSRVSRRFGEGIVNGALTARVGVAAIEVCRPLAFRRLPRPSVTALVRRALTGLFGSGN